MKKFVLILVVAFFSLVLSANQISAMEPEEYNQRVSWIGSLLQRINNGVIGKSSQKFLSLLNGAFQKLSFQNLSPVQKTFFVLSCVVLVEHIVARHVCGDSMDDEDFIQGVYDQLSDFIGHGVDACLNLADTSLEGSEQDVFEECIGQFHPSALEYCQSLSVSAEECEQSIPWIQIAMLTKKAISMFSNPSRF